MLAQLLRLLTHSYEGRKTLSCIDSLNFRNLHSTPFSRVIGSLPSLYYNSLLERSILDSKSLFYSFNFFFYWLIFLKIGRPFFPLLGLCSLSPSFLHLRFWLNPDLHITSFQTFLWRILFQLGKKPGNAWYVFLPANANSEKYSI